MWVVAYAVSHSVLNSGMKPLWPIICNLCTLSTAKIVKNSKTNQTKQPKHPFLTWPLLLSQKSLSYSSELLGRSANLLSLSNSKSFQLIEIWFRCELKKNAVSLLKTRNFCRRKYRIYVLSWFSHLRRLSVGKKNTAWKLIQLKFVIIWYF